MVHAVNLLQLQMDCSCKLHGFKKLYSRNGTMLIIITDVYNKLNCCIYTCSFDSCIDATTSHTTYSVDIVLLFFDFVQGFK